MKRVLTVFSSLLLMTFVASAQTDTDKLSIHGYLTQAWADSDGNQFAGIPGDGTTDYRTAALQLRYAMSEDDDFVFQLSHEKTGESPINDLREDIELDFVFYQRRFGDSSIKVGRVPIPYGIYNEIRDVGTLLPFYRPAILFYGDTIFTSETVDGVVFGHHFDAGDWGLSVDVFGGSWEIPDSDLSGYIDADDAFGGQFWIETPIDGLRFGAGLMDFELEPGVVTGGFVSDVDQWHASIDARVGRWTAQVEHREIEIEASFIDVVMTYAHLGFDFTEKFGLSLQHQESELDLVLPFIGPHSTDFHEDSTIGIRYSFRYDIVLKAEFHSTEGFLTEVPEPLIGFAPAAETDYSIVSLSVSF